MLETDPEQFDCDTCEVRIEQDRLSPENVEAWELFNGLMNRWLWESHGIAEMFLALTEDSDSHERLEMIERCATIYDILYPPPTDSDGS